MRQLLEKFETELTLQHEYSDVESVTSVIQRVKDLLERNEEVAAEIAGVLIESGFLDELLEDEREDRYKKFVESRTAKTAAYIEEQLVLQRDELDNLVKQYEGLEAEIESEVASEASDAHTRARRAESQTR